MSQNVRQVNLTSGPQAPRTARRPRSTIEPRITRHGQLAGAAPSGRVIGETTIPVTPPVIQVDDELERRIRKPVDALRCVISSSWILLLAVAAVTASATTAGVETDIVGASRRLPHSLLVVAPPVALFALLVLPVGLAVDLLVRQQPYPIRLVNWFRSK
jgi:hypothetical protein